MCDCGRLYSSTLLAALFVLSGVVKVVSVECEKEFIVGTGNGVRVQAACYPNGTVSYNWNSAPSTWHLLVEYQCYNNGSTHEQTPNPVRPGQLSWSDLDSGDDTFSVQPWEEGTSCVFSGCYDNSVERGYPTYWIPDATCTVVTIMTSASAFIKSTSPSVNKASTSSSQPLLPTPTLPPALSPPSSTTLSPTSPSPTTPSPATLSPATLSPTSPSPTTPSPATLSPATPSPTAPSLTTQSLSQTRVGTSSTVQPDAENQDMTVLLIAVPVVTVLIVIAAAVCLVAVLIVVMVKKRSKHRPRLKVGNDMLKGDFPPVSLAICNPIPGSLETLHNVLETPSSHTYLLDYENTPKTYKRRAPPKAVEADNSVFLDSADELSDLNSILVPPDDGSNVTESAKGGVTVADNDSIGTHKTSEEEGNEAVKATEVEEEIKEEEEEDEEEEEEVKEEKGRELVCSDLSGHVAYTEGKSDTYESLESTKHWRFGLPEGVGQPFALGPGEPIPIDDATLADSFSAEGDYLRPTSQLQTNSSGISGYVTDLSMMNTATPAPLRVQSVNGEV